MSEPAGERQPLRRETLQQEAEARQERATELAKLMVFNEAMRRKLEEAERAGISLLVLRPEDLPSFVRSGNWQPLIQLLEAANKFFGFYAQQEGQEARILADEMQSLGSDDDAATETDTT